MTVISKNFIQNTDNYNITFQDNCTTIFTKYMLIISEYLKHCLDNIYSQNPIYYKYLVNRGISTLTHVFKFILIYTKNLDMAYYNCQKAYIYYIEFIGQISDDNHSFLQLNAKDASLFVYKKTIFDINNDVRKDHVSDFISDKLLSDVELLIQIYNSILLKLLDNHKIIDVIKYINRDVHNIMQKIIKIYIDANTSDIVYKIKAILTFTIHYKNDDLLDYLDIFIKKIKKKSNINLIKLEQLLLDNNNNNQLPIKYINYIISQI
jgi:hypothetical protein